MISKAREYFWLSPQRNSNKTYCSLVTRGLPVMIYTGKSTWLEIVRVDLKSTKLRYLMSETSYSSRIMEDALERKEKL